MGLRILYSSWDEAYKTPFGTLTPGQPCTMRISIPISCQTRSVTLVLQREDGSLLREETFSLEGILPPYETYCVTFTLQEPALLFYYFRIRTANETFKLLRAGEETNMEAGELWQLSCVAQDYPVPEEFQGRVFYQIFPDRFHQAGSCDCREKLQPYWVHWDKSETPVYRPNERGEVLNNDFYGGNLAGIREKLPYLHELGIEALYLNPIFMAFSTHRYDTADYSRIDPMLGTEEDFRQLCCDAHALGMKIILDGVFSHTGANSVYFDAEGIFGHGAVSDPQSPYRSWYQFKRYPDEYEAWWGFKTLPAIDKASSSYMDYIFGADDSIVAKWLRLGADGFRLDVADELPDAFLMALRRRLRQLNPNALLIGEVWEDASNKIAYGVRRQYFTKNQLDGVMNYPWRKAILDFARGTEDGPGLRWHIMTLAENYPAQVLNTNFNLLSSHDIPRALTHLIDPTNGEREELAQRRHTPEQLAWGKERLALAWFLQFTLPGCPCVYYGDEAGMTGYRDPFNRTYYPWGGEDRALQSLLQDLVHMRRGNEILRRGSVRVLYAGGSRISYRRTLDGRTVTCYCNCSHASWPVPNGGKVLLGSRELPPMSFCAIEE